ncbi:MAG: RusA family crossover junction endodeoxyribonuclease [Selenomonadaceae bacterium]|nr:RusA family crossover junction endodeoxyribonuclease [Selenomonadaceae bacterium]
MIFFSAPLNPVPFCRPAQSGRRRFNNPRYSAFKDQFALFALRAMRGRNPFTGAIKITADFYKARPKKTKHHCGDFAIAPSVGDVDNFLKAVLDALNGICYVDDSQVVDAHARKFFGIPHIEVRLEEIK